MEYGVVHSTPCMPPAPKVIELVVTGIISITLRHRETGFRDSHISLLQVTVGLYLLIAMMRFPFQPTYKRHASATFHESIKEGFDEDSVSKKLDLK